MRLGLRVGISFRRLKGSYLSAPIKIGLFKFSCCNPTVEMLVCKGRFFRGVALRGEPLRGCL